MLTLSRLVRTLQSYFRFGDVRLRFQEGIGLHIRNGEDTFYVRTQMGSLRVHGDSAPFAGLIEVLGGTSNGSSAVFYPSSSGLTYNLRNISQNFQIVRIDTTITNSQLVLGQLINGGDMDVNALQNVKTERAFVHNNTIARSFSLGAGETAVFHHLCIGDGLAITGATTAALVIG